MAKSYHYEPAGEINIATTGTITALDPQGNQYVRMTNATLATIAGIKPGYDGQMLTIASKGAGEVDFNNLDATATTGGQIALRSTSANTALAAGAGKMTLIYSVIAGQWVLVYHDQGDYINEPYNAANFTAASGSWTVDSGDQNTFKYWLRGNVLEVVYDLITTSVTATPATLRAKLPNATKAATLSGSGSFFPPLAWTADNAVDQQAVVEAAASHSTQIYWYKFGGGNWTTVVNNTRITAQVFIPVQ